jgi:hypothetical protein
MMTMPQRSFWSERHEVSIAFGFALDPLTPGAPPTMTAAVYDQEREQTVYRSLKLPPALAEDAFLDLVQLYYRTWMLVDGAAAQAALIRQLRNWWRHEDDLSVTR